jgi:hypothetical protein
MNDVATLGFRAHSGWAVVVAVAGTPDQSLVLERRRIEIADIAIPGSKQPYHAAEPLAIDKAESLIRKCRDSSISLATRAIVEMVDQLKERSICAVGAGILFAAGRPLPDLAATLRSHALIHTAEGEFFREVLVSACEQCSLPVAKIKESQAWDRGAALFRATSTDLQRRIGELGKSIGPPWRQDEKLASLAAWIALVDAQQDATPA